jgi:spore coat polysaccharide biosynthesis predicted glycosyltransferase SpsG
MFALCIESSHQRGMGHFYRSLVLAGALTQAGLRCKFYINNHEPSQAILRARGFAFDVVTFADHDGEWERRFIARDGIAVWINDRHRTDAAHAVHIKDAGLPLVTFDDRGTGAAYADLHIAGLAFDKAETLGGARVLRGLDYLILNPDIARVRRPRRGGNKIIVTMGGADTYGITVTVMRHLAAAGRSATVILGPSFAHHRELEAVISPAFSIKQSVASLIDELDSHDLAITAGGMTPIEACAAGVPCIIVAAEDFEIPSGRALVALGGAVFAGHYSEMDAGVFSRDLPLAAMSKAALAGVKLDGTRRVVEALVAL